MLSHEEIKRIKEEESFRAQLRKELSPKTRGTILDFFNSPLGLWLLGSVILGLISFLWNHWTNQRVQAQQRQEAKVAEQREDSQFLASLLPYLTNADLKVRLRTVQVIKVRYAENEIPVSVQRLMAEVVVEGNQLRAPQDADTQHLLARATTVVDRISVQDPSIVSELRQLPPRVYIQISDEAQRVNARNLQANLSKQGFIVPGIENVTGKLGAPDRVEIRYFNDADQVAASRIRQLMIQAGFGDAMLARMSLKANPGTLEIWFPGVTGQMPPPIITSAPTIFHDGQIKGSDFGGQPGQVRLHLRVKPSAQTGDYSANSGFGPDRLLGNLDGSNNPIVGENMLQGWSDHTIQLSLPSSYWDNLMLTIERVGDERKITPPQRADLQVCYLVERAVDDKKSAIFCQE